MLLILLVFTDVDVPVRIYFVALAFLLIVEVVTLVNPAITVQRYSSTVLPMLHRFAEVYTVIVTHQSKVREFKQFSDTRSQ
jgi:hypothetical protein